MPNLFLHSRVALCAKLYMLVFVAIVSSAATTPLDSLPTRGTSLLREDTPSSFLQSAFKRYGRIPAAVMRAVGNNNNDEDNDDDMDDDKRDDKDDDLDLSLKDPHNANLPNLDIDKEDREDAVLFRRSKDIFDGKKLEDVSHEKPLRYKDLSREAKELGLTEEDLKDLDDIEAGKVSVQRLGSKDKRDPDERPRDVPPPPGMVANPREMKQVTEDVNLDQGFELDRPPEPRAPSHIRHNSSRESTDDSTTSSIQDNSEYEERILALSRKLEDARREISEARREAADAQHQVSELRIQHERSKRAFQRSLDSERKEDEDEKEEMSVTIKEQKRAFDELYEEKQLLSQMLSDEQKTLKGLQEKIQHPDLGLWVRQRAEKAAILVETPETDAVKYYAKKYMAPKVTKMRHRLELLEKRVERTVDHLLPAKYGSVVALLLSIGLVGFPIIVTMSTVVSLTKSVSLRQYVLLGNVFLTAFAAGLCIAGILLRQDPLQTLYEASETLFIMLQLTTAVAFPVFLGVIGCAVLKSRDRLDAFVFGCEFVFYSLVAMNYRSRVWRPAMLGQNIETSVMMYAIYLMDFMSMTALTISSSRIDETSTIRDPDPEIGIGAKKAGTTGSGLIQGSVSSKVSSLSSGLIQAAMGQGRSGKEE